MNVMNAGLCQNGAVLTGRELEQYSRRKGLCQICAGSETHKRAGKLFKRNQWEPLTVRSNINGSSGEDINSCDYLVYKGYCLQPTCYTLEQAKELLGEKPTSRQRPLNASLVVASEKRSSGAYANANTNAKNTSASALPKSKSTPPVTWKRASSTGSASNHNNTSSSSLSVCDYVRSSSHNSSRSVHNNTPRRGSYSTHYGAASQRMLNNSQQSLNDSASSITSPSGRRQDYRQQQQRQRMSSTRSGMSGRLSPTESMLGSPSSSLHTWSRDVPFITLPTLENRDTASASATTTATEALNWNDGGREIRDQDLIFGDITEENSSCGSVMGNAAAANKAKKVYRPAATTQKKLKGRTIKKLMKALTGKKHEQQVSSSDSATSASLSSESWIQAILPGSGFVARAATFEGAFRAVQALDLAANDNAQGTSFCSNHLGSQNLDALCLQSQRLDIVDIETVLAGDEVDSLHRRWLSEESLLDDYDFDHDSINSKDDMVDNHDVSPNDAHEIFFDISRNLLVRLSHVCSGDMEELELEANLDDFLYDDIETKPLENPEEEKKDDDSESTPFLVFKTRASLESEISRCEQAVDIAEQSDDPSTIQTGIEARGRLDMLLPLREVHMTKYQLKTRIKQITRSLQDLDANKLVARYEFAMEKDQLTKQLNEEVLEENKIQQHVTLLHEPEDFRLPGQSAKVHVRSHMLKSVQVKSRDVSRKETTNSRIDVGSRRSIVSELGDNITDIGMETQAHMTVFQSAPLAYVDPITGTHHVCPLLDFEYEARALTQSLKDAKGKSVKVNLEFDIATTDRLSAFLANSESRVMHLSCHGHPEYLALENGFGGMQVLSVQDLKRFVGVGAGNLEVVFVSACHSKAAGTAFLEAGIKHVICCRQDDKFRDEGAIEFARSFYRAVALNNTLKQAFKIAQEAMRVSPMVRNSKAEYEKFILLPELPDSDPYHDVHIFQHNIGFHSLAPSEGTKLRDHSRMLPRVPQFFIGRESDMYTVLEALRSSDLVRIQGGPGVGKSTLVAATARYIEQRQKSFLFDDILWLTAQQESVDSKDTLSLSFSRLLKVIARARDTLPQRDLAYREYWGLLLRQIQGKRTLIVIDGKDFTTMASLEGLGVFLSDLLKISNAKVIAVGLPWTEQEPMESTTITIDALDFDATVLLFSRVASSPSFSAKQIISGLAAFPRSDNSASETLKHWRRRKIYECIGKGIPSNIRRSAQNMSDADLAELLKKSKRPLAAIDSRSELVAKIKELEESEAFQQKNKQFLAARDTNEMIKELHCLSRHFPSLEELEETEKDLQHSLQIATASKQYENADQLQRCLATVHKQISMELGTAQPANGPPPATARNQ